jgi:hypothetical protein
MNTPHGENNALKGLIKQKVTEWWAGGKAKAKRMLWKARVS